MKRERFWQRPLKDGRIETYFSADGHFVHLWASPEATQVVLSHFEEATGIKLPASIERKPALYGRRRRRPGQLTFEDALA